MPRRKGKFLSTAAQRRGAGLVAAVGVVLLAVLLLSMGSRPAVEPEPPTEPEPTAPMPEPNPYLPSDFAPGENGFLTCTVANAVAGVDVSEHQGQIDWQQAADSGIRFAVIRVGYRGYGSGTLVEDSCALENLRGAREAGLQIGAYFYSQAITPEEAAQEAEFAAKTLRGITLELPLVFDWEYVSADARTGDITRSQLTACAQSFCEAAEKAGFTPMIYFNLDMSRTLFDLSALRDYPFWFAQYNDGLDFPYRVRLWQYTNSGSVPGIDGNVDVDLLLP